MEQGRHVFPGDDGGRVGLLVVAAELGPPAVISNAYGDGHAKLLADAAAQRVRNGFAAAEKPPGAGHVQPAFVHREGLHLIGEVQVDGVDAAGHGLIFLVMGRQQDQVRALAPGLPDGLGGLHAHFLCGHVLRQDDAVAALRVSCDGHRLVPQLRILEQLYGGVEIVAVAVEDAAVSMHRHPRAAFQS